ncbi:MAG: hypothetical protein AABY15_03330 [Nanoarchaeota archaeon]
MNKVIPREEFLPTHESVVAQGINVPDWEKDHIHVLERIKAAFPNLEVFGDEKTFSFVIAIPNLDPKLKEHATLMATKTAEGHRRYHIGHIHFAFPTETGHPLRKDIDISLCPIGKERSYASVDWDVKMELSKEWMKSLRLRYATIGDETVDNIIEYLKTKLS